MAKVLGVHVETACSRGHSDLPDLIARRERDRDRATSFGHLHDLRHGLHRAPRYASGHQLEEVEQRKRDEDAG